MVTAVGEGAEAVSLARMSGGTEIGKLHLIWRNFFTWIFSQIRYFLNAD
jgi:hypothetical protein